MQPGGYRVGAPMTTTSPTPSTCPVAPPIPHTAAPLSTRWGLLAVLLAFAFLHVGCWTTGGYLGDESSYLYEALQAHEQGIPVRSLYYNAYKLIFTLLTADPLYAHLLLRVGVSLVVTFSLWAWLRRFPAVSGYAAAITSCWWACSFINVPLVQMGLAPLFCLALVLPALAWALRAGPLTGGLTLLLGLLAAATVRPEYLAPALLIAGYLLLQQGYLRRRDPAAWRRQLSGRALLPLAGLLLVLALFVCLPGPAGRSNYDSYLLTGLTQGYAQRYVRAHPEVTLNPYREASRLTNEIFGNPAGFTSAARHNPAALLGYLCDNGLDNLRMLVPLLLLQRVLPGLPITVAASLGQVALLIAVGLAGILLWVWRHRAARLAAAPAAPATTVAPRWRQVLHWLLTTPAAVLPVLLGAAAGVPLLVHVQEPRLWLSLVPLVYLGLAWGLTQVLALAASARPAQVLLLLAVGWWCAPLFPGASSNQALVLPLRAYGAALDHVPVLGGPSSSMLATYAFGTRFTAAEDLNDDLLNRLRHGEFDAFVAGNAGLLSSAFAAEHREFFTAFFAHPEDFGYRALPPYEGEEETLRLYLHQPPRPGPAAAAVPASVPPLPAAPRS